MFPLVTIDYLKNQASLYKQPTFLKRRSRRLDLQVLAISWTCRHASVSPDHNLHPNKNQNGTQKWMRMEDDFPFQLGDFDVNHVNFQGRTPNKNIIFRVFVAVSNLKTPMTSNKFPSCENQTIFSR